MNLQGHTLNGLEQTSTDTIRQNVFGWDPSRALYNEMIEVMGGERNRGDTRQELT